MTLEAVPFIEPLYAYYHQNSFQNNKYYFLGSASTRGFQLWKQIQQILLPYFAPKFLYESEPTNVFTAAVDFNRFAAEYLALVGAFNCGRETRLLIGK